jgi:four helix bundle protein
LRFALALDDKEFKQFLNISRGSCGEVKSMYYTAEDQKYVLCETTIDGRYNSDVLITKITNFMFYLKK